MSSLLDKNLHFRIKFAVREGKQDVFCGNFPPLESFQRGNQSGEELGETRREKVSKIASSGVSETVPTGAGFWIAASAAVRFPSA